MLVKDDGDHPGLRNASNHRRVVFPDQSSHLHERDTDCLSHFRACKIARPKVELSYTMSTQRVSLDLVVPISLVLGQHYPRAFRDKLKPHLVLGAGRKMVAMSMMVDAVGD